MNIVTLSPIRPESLYDASTGVDGAGGGTVSTEKLNGATTLLVLGASSFAVRVCAPSDRGTVTPMQTFERESEANVPIATPSMKTRYEDLLPSP